MIGVEALGTAVDPPPPPPVPESVTIKQMLDTLLEPEISVQMVAPRTRSSEWRGLLAPLVKDNGLLAAALLADAAFAHRAASAMLMEPASEAVDPRIDEMVLDAAREVLNVISGALNSRTTPHVKIEGCYEIPGTLPPSADALLSYPLVQREYQIGIGDYGSGRLTVLTW